MSSTSPLRADVVIYGGGPAALMAAHELAAAGVSPLLVGPVEAARWPSLPTGGLDGGSDPEALFLDTIVGGDYLAARPPVRAMAEAAAGLVDWLAAIGAPFAKEGGRLSLRRLDGCRTARAVFVEARTTQAVTHALDAQCARLGVARLPHHELCALVPDRKGRCAGCVVQDLVSMAMVPVAADAMILATGGLELSFSGSPAALCTESALAVAFEAGAVLANMEMIQTVPAAVWLGPRIAGSPRGRRVLTPSASLRGEGAIFWLPTDDEESRLGRDVPRDERRRFLDQAHPGWGSALPDDIAAALVRKEAVEQGLFDRKRKKRQPLAYLDVSHLPVGHLKERLGSELDLCKLLSGADPYRGPLPVHAALSDRLGGLWVDFEAGPSGRMRVDSPRNHSSSIEGLYACGGACHLVHGANRLSGNLLLADLFGARMAARAVRSFRDGLEAAGDGADWQAAQTSAATAYEELRRREGGAPPAALHARLREALYAGAGVWREREAMGALLGQIEAVVEALSICGPRDGAESANRGVPLLRALEHAAALAEATARSALAREESRGVHRRSDHPGRIAEDGFARDAPPFLTLCRKDDGGVRIEGQARYEQLGAKHAIVAEIDEAGIDEVSHPRRYREER